MRNELQLTDRAKYALLALVMLLFALVGMSRGELATSGAATAVAPTETAQTETAEIAWMHPSELPAVQAAEVDEETLWLARCIYSETKRAEEQELVAWSIRNRVETGYRGETSYRGVVLDPWQFSAFNHNSRKRGYFMSLVPSSQAAGWQQALRIAKYVKEAPASLRPFPQTVRHYYSERSMVGRSHPAWAAGQTPIAADRPYEIEARRFRFFDGIA